MDSYLEVRNSQDYNGHLDLNRFYVTLLFVYVTGETGFRIIRIKN